MPALLQSFVVCKLLLIVTLLALPSLCPATFAADENWPEFRGPRGNGHSTATNLPVKFDDKTHVAWKTEIPGDGHSSPVIAGNRIWLTTAVMQTLTEEEKKQRLAGIKNPRGLEIAGGVSFRAVCVQQDTGKLLHNIEVFRAAEPGPIHSLNSYASPTPAITGEHVYVHFGSYGTACLHLKTGKRLWEQTSLVVDHQNGPGASPILWGDLLIAQYDGIDKQFVAALDRHTGEILWQTKRSGKLPEKAEFQKAYATPHVVMVKGEPVLISPGSDWVYGYEPATGKERWRISYGQLGFSTVPRPVIGHDMAFVCTSFMQSRLLAIRYDGQGDATKSHVVWQSDRQVPKKPSLLLVGDELYLLNDGGILTCLDAHTGEEHYKERLGGQYSASPLLADGKIFLCSQEGKVLVVQPGTEYKLLAENTFPAGIMASPAALDQAVYLRTDTHLYRLQTAKP